MARVNLDEQFFGGDKRIDFLADVSNERSYITRGRLIQIYYSCYKRKTAVCTQDEIAMQSQWLGEPPYADLMAKAHLAESVGPTLYRIRGIEERIQYLIEQQERGRRGGKKSALLRQANAQPNTKQT